MIDAHWFEVGIRYADALTAIRAEGGKNAGGQVFFRSGLPSMFLSHGQEFSYPPNLIGPKDR